MSDQFPDFPELQRTHHRRFARLRRAVKSPLETLSKLAGPIQFLLTGASFIESRRLEKQAREALYDQRAIQLEIDLSDAGRPLPCVVGLAAVDGLLAFADVGSNVPWQPAEADRFGLLGYYEDPDDGRTWKEAPVKGNARDEFLLTQTMLARHDIAELIHVEVDGQNGHHAPMTAQLGRQGTASEFATRFAQGFGRNPGNGQVKRSANSTYPLGSHVTAIAWQDVDGIPHYTRMPRYRHLLKGNLLQPVEAKTTGGKTTHSLGEAAWSRSSPLVLLWAYMADWGFNETPSEETLKSIKDAEAFADAIMQGKGGLWTQAYPALFNAIEGTAYPTYQAAFNARGFASYASLSQTRLDLTDSSDPGSETGWPAPPRDTSASLSIIQANDQSYLIQRCQCYGTFVPGRNTEQIFGAIMQTMPFSSFGRELASGERVLRIADLTGAVAGTEDMIVRKGEWASYTISPPADALRAVTVRFADVAQNGAQSSVTYPLEKRDGADTPATRYIDARFNDRDNRLVVDAPLVGNKYQATAVAFAIWIISNSNTVQVTKGGANQYADVGDRVRLVGENGDDVVFLVTGHTVRRDGAQNIVGLVLQDGMGAWPVALRQDARVTEVLDRPLPTASPICAEFEDGVVLLDFECETATDDDGNEIIRPASPKFEAGCDADRFVTNGRVNRLDLPTMGPGQAAYTTSDLATGITYDADEHQLVLAANVLAGDYNIVVNGTVGDTTASCTFKLTVVQAAVGFDIEVTRSPGAVGITQLDTYTWHFYLPRETTSVTINIEVVGSDGGDAPDSATVKFDTDAEIDLPKDDGSMVASKEYGPYTGTVDRTAKAVITANEESIVANFILAKPDAR